MFKSIEMQLKLFDSNLTENLDQFFKPLAPFKELPFFADRLPEFTKIIVYSLFILAPLLLLKILFPYRRRFTYPILLVLGVMGLSLFGIFLGFLQLLYGSQ